MDNSIYISKYEKYLKRVEDWLKQNFKVYECPEKVIYESMYYSLMAGGKRIRPVLSLAVAEMLSGDLDTVLPFACAIEMIHNYSLIHDDLPCMDDDDFRRGKPTNHKVFGEAIAVLAGDGLLNMAFETLLKEVAKSHENSHLKAKAAFLIAEAAGIKGMIGGQVLDMESENKTIGYDRLCDMHRKKTGALIKSSILAPAVLLGASSDTENALKIYADKIGLAFQIKDDILDYEGNSEIVGKPTGSDEKNSKSTFVTLLGMEEAKKLLEATVRQAKEVIEPFNNAEFLIKTAYYIADRDK